MRHARRSAAVLLSLLLLLAACAAPSDSRSARPAPLTDTGLPELVFPLIVSGEAPSGLDLMQEQMNEYVAEKLEITIRFIPVDISSLENYYLLQKSGTGQTDFICLLPAASQLSEIVAAGLVLPLDSLLDRYGRGILEAASEVLETGRLGGEQYMIPAVKDVYTMGTSIEFSAALVKKYGFDITSVRTLADLEPMLEVIARSEPDVVPFAGDPEGFGFTPLLGGYDSLGDTLGVLNLAEDSSLTVVDWYETERFHSLVSRMRDWYLKGWIARDTLTDQQSVTRMLQQGEAFCSLGTIMPTGDQGTDPDNPSGLVEIQLPDLPQLLSTYQAGLEGVCISSSCRYPEKAMEFLNLLYTDPHAVNLMEYGVEGVHYTLTPEGRADTGGSRFLLFGQPLNQTLRLPSDSGGDASGAETEAFRRRSTVSPAFGFVFDSSPAAREVALCRAAVEQYFSVIDCGCVDPETELPRFIAALKEAGIDAVVAEKQRQLDAWAQQ